MIDARLLRDDPDRIRAAQVKRGLAPDVVDRALAADESRRSAIATFEAKRAEQKALGKKVAQAQGAEKAEGKKPGSRSHSELRKRKWLNHR